MLVYAEPRLDRDGAPVRMRGRIEIPWDARRPTLADMLAASLARRALEGVAAPKGTHAFLQHARAQEEGPGSDKLPLELSVEGIFLAARHSEALSEASERRLLDVWQRLEAAVMTAAREGIAPADLALTGPEFAEQRLLLARDRVLFATDLEEAELWSCPAAEAGTTVVGVVVQVPRSKFFERWLARKSWLQAGYLLVVQSGKRWTIRKDSGVPIPLQPMLAALQVAEESSNPKLARADPWTLEGDTSIQGPLAGSRLPADAVLAKLRELLQAQPLAAWRKSQLDQLLGRWDRTFPGYKNPTPVPGPGDMPRLTAHDSRGSPLLLRIHGVYGPAEAALQQSGLEIEKLRLVEKRCRSEKVGGRARLLTYRRVRRLEDDPKLFAQACPGGTTDLRSWRSAQDRIGIGDVFSILRDVATALEKLHSWGICHLDVQPDSVLVAKNLARPRALLTNCGCSLAADGSLSRLPDPLFAPPDLRKADVSWDVFSFAMLVAFIVRGDCAEPFRDPADGGAHRDIMRPARARKTVDGVEDGWYERLGALLIEATNETPGQRLGLVELREAILELPLDAAGTTSEQIIDDIFGEDDDGAGFDAAFDPEPSGSLPVFAPSERLSVSEDSLPTLVEDAQKLRAESEGAAAAVAAASAADEPEPEGEAEEERPASNTIGKLKRLDQFYGKLLAETSATASPRKVTKAPRSYVPSPESGDEGEEPAAPPAAKPMEVSSARDGGKLQVMTTFEMLEAIQEEASEGDEDGYPLAPTPSGRTLAPTPSGRTPPRRRSLAERSRSERNLRPSGRVPSDRIPDSTQRVPSSRIPDSTQRLRGGSTGRLPLVPPAAPLREGRSRTGRPETAARSGSKRPASAKNKPARGTPRNPSASGPRGAVPPAGARPPAAASGGGRPRSERTAPARPPTRKLARAEIAAATRKPRRPVHDKPASGRPAPEKFHRTLGPVGLIKRLGAGGFASVYLGQHLKSHAKVAVKVLNKKAANERVINRFIVEAKLLKKIKNKHLVRVYEIGEADGLRYIVMEYIDGWSCEDLLKMVKSHKRPGLAELSALVIIEAATRGLAELHKLGVIHRDIKPANIMVPRISADGRESQDERLQSQTIEGIVPPELRQCKLIDLGIAKTEQSNLTATGVGMGTLGYAPPEQLVEAKEVTPASDVFSMGATLYFLLTGRPPFEGKFSEVVGKTLQGKFVPLFMRCPGVGRRLDKLVARCLAKNSAQRFPDAVALLKAIEETRRLL